MATSARNTDNSPLMTTGSFANLLATYHWDKVDSVDQWNNYTYANPNSSGYNDLLAPFYIVTSGEIYPDFGGIIEVNHQARLWGGSASDVKHDAYNYNHMTDLLQPTNIWARHIALSLHP